jgi:hypothetical protein
MTQDLIKRLREIAMLESANDVYLAENSAEWKAADALDARAAEIVQLRAERDEYQQAADKMAMEHKVERDTLRAELEASKKDAARLDWLNLSYSTYSINVLSVSGLWYTRSAPGMPFTKRENLREAIDAAMQSGKK